jgi:hypothetical protein
VSEAVRYFGKGGWITESSALLIVRDCARKDFWEDSEVEAIWGRLVDDNEAYEERLECAETICRITNENLEIFVPEPQ